jgi:maltose/maltodextrin transport system substrate-binding protein/arabinogalactan oligomer/maltooligosaccharide transport system substrate-binding protein
MRSPKFLAILVMVALMLSAAGFATAQDEPLLIWADEISAAVINEIAGDFTDEYGVEVEVQQFQFDEIRQQFIQTAPTGEGPDVIIGAHDWLGEMVTNGVISPVDLAGLEEEFNTNGITAFTYDGTLYGVPYAIDNIAFFRNVDLVPEAPATWDEVRAISEELAEQDVFGYMIQQRDPWHSYPLFSAFGGYVFGFEEGVGYNPEDVGLDSEGAIAAYEFAGNLIADGLMPSGLEQESMWSLFAEGEGAMMMTGPWALETLRESGVNFEVSRIPDGPGGPARPFLSARGFMISSFSEQPAVAQIFLSEFIANDDTMQALFDAESRPPAWLAVEIEDPVVGAFQEAGADGAPQPAIPEMGAVWESWANMMELSLGDPSIAAAEAANAAEQVRAAIAAAAE